MKTISPDRERTYSSSTKDNDSLNVQLETVRLNGVRTKNMTKNVIPIVLKLSEDVGQHHKNNKILKIKIKIVSASEPPCMTYVQDSLARRDVTLSAAPKNNGMKAHKDALSANCVSLPQNQQLSADFIIDRNVMSQASRRNSKLILLFTFQLLGKISLQLPIRQFDPMAL
jgi:hypothetical protein